MLMACSSPSRPHADIAPPRASTTAVDAALAEPTSPALEPEPAPPASPSAASGNVGTWREVAKAPRAAGAGVPSRTEPAPGRTDSAGQISGYCPPRAVVFELGNGHSLVTREPCSGVTEITIREGKRERRVADSILYGVVGTWQVQQLDQNRVLMISQGTTTNLQLVDLAAARARWIRLPVPLERGQGLLVAHDRGEIFVWGGTVEVAIGSQGCENPPPNMGCDPVAIVKHVPNPKVWALRPD